MTTVGFSISSVNTEVAALLTFPNICIGVKQKFASEGLCHRNSFSKINQNGLSHIHWHEAGIDSKTMRELLTF